MIINMIYGKKAFSLLAEKSFCQNWELLFEKCPWATAFQSRAFISTWYEVYREQYLPVLLVSYSDVGRFNGLLPLALSNHSDEIVVAGAWQAEYQCWLSDLEHGNKFIIEAIKSVRQHFSNKTLIFRFIPPQAPIGWLTSNRGMNFPYLLEEHACPIIDLKEISRVEDSLRKKSNKSRLNRLKKLGHLRFERIEDVAVLSPFLDDIIDYYDFRQGATSGVLPFRDDHLKRSFHIAMMEKRGLLHVTVLQVNDRIIAAHMGVCSKKMVHLGIIAHSPFEARHSPGKLHILLLSKMLSEEGYHRFDLTPSGAYKSRFASMHDRVFSLTIFASQSKLSLSLIKRKARSFVRRTLETIKVEPEVVKSLISELNCDGIVRIPLRLVWMLRNKLWHTVEFRVFVFDHDCVHGISDSNVILRDCLAHILKYIPVGTLQSRNYFLTECMKRLERGEHVYTFVKGKKLLHYCWLADNLKNLHFSESERTLEIPPHSSILYDFFVYPHAQNKQLFNFFILQVLTDIAISVQYDNIFIAAADNGLCQQVIETLGVSREACFFKKVRFGRIQRWSIFSPTGTEE